MPFRPFFGRSQRLTGLMILAALVVGLAALGRPGWLRWMGRQRALSAEVLDVETLQGFLPTSPTARVGVLEQVWNSRKFPHRLAVLQDLGRSTMREPALQALTIRVIREAALDPDLSLRELALGLGTAELQPTIQAAVAWQLDDVDAEVRKMGLQQLRRFAKRDWVPEVLPVLDDPDPTVQLAADAVLRQITGQDMSLRLSDFLPADPSSLIPKEIEPELQRRLEQGRSAWQRWWAVANTNRSAKALAERRPVWSVGPEIDFQLTDSQGKTFELASLRGRPVLLNFWTTWCPACLTEMPVLAELQRRHPNDFAIVGISLDTLAAEGAVDGANAETKKGTEASDAWPALRQRVGSTAARHRAGYRMLLDPENQVGQRFNGGELPTQVLLDAEGRIRRRFVGTRSLADWERLLAEIQVSSAGFK